MFSTIWTVSLEQVLSFVDGKNGYFGDRTIEINHITKVFNNVPDFL